MSENRVVQGSLAPTLTKLIALRGCVCGGAGDRVARKQPVAVPSAPRQLLGQTDVRTRGQVRPLLLLDFDKTITDFDAGERLVGEIAPELAPMLASLEMPANFVPVTNAVLGEMQRRGVSRDAILTELRRMGTEIPPASLQLLRVLLPLQFIH